MECGRKQMDFLFGFIKDEFSRDSDELGEISNELKYLDKLNTDCDELE